MVGPRRFAGSCRSREKEFSNFKSASSALSVEEGCQSSRWLLPATNVFDWPRRREAAFGHNGLTGLKKGGCLMGVGSSASTRKFFALFHDPLRSWATLCSATRSREFLADAAR